MKYLLRKELEHLPTKRLLSLYRKRRRNKDNLVADLTDYGCFPEKITDKELEDDGVILYYKLNEYCKTIKSILDKRENVI